MREHLVALVYILLMAGVSFVVMQRPLTARLMEPSDFARRRNAWLAVTLITFLAHHFWLAMLLSALAVAWAARGERNPVALYCVLLLAVPQFQMPIEGIGAINKFIEMDHPRMLALVVLLPAAVTLLSAPASQRNPRLFPADLLFGTYFFYVFAVNATSDSITGMMRALIVMLLEHVLPYYVITRSVRSQRQMLDVLTSFVMGLTVLSVIAVFENLRYWLVYESLRAPLGVPPASLTMYLLRETESGGYFRAMTTAGNAIAMGCMVMTAVVMQVALVRHYRPKWLGVAVVLMLLGGLVAPVSRGPWLACAAALALGLAFGEGAKRRLLWMSATIPAALLFLIFHPAGEKIIELLPFVGTVESGNVTYRQELINRALVVFWQNPVFGSLQYLNNPVLEAMRQGQGIIDIVNSYVGVALAYGGVGLLLFIAPSAWAMVASVLASRRAAPGDAAAEATGRALAACLLSMMVVIGTVSYISHIPIVHWMLVALCSAYVAYSPQWQRAPAPPVVDPRRQVLRPMAHPRRG